MNDFKKEQTMKLVDLIDNWYLGPNKASEQFEVMRQIMLAEQEVLEYYRIEMEDSEREGLNVK